VAEEIWHDYGGSEAARQRGESLLPEICGNHESAGVETREWLAWYELLAASPYPPTTLPTEEEIQLRVWTTRGSFFFRAVGAFRPFQLPSALRDKQCGTFRGAKLVRLMQASGIRS
jgi:hypothetical protein